MTDFRTPGPLRLLAAFSYDLLILFGLLLLVTTLTVIPAQLLFNINDAIGSHPLFRLLLVSVILIFYVWFWTHGGQTLGMRAWRIKVVARDGTVLSYSQAWVRLLAGVLLFGITIIWMPFNTERQTLHDKLAGTRLVLLPKQ